MNTFELQLKAGGDAFGDGQHPSTQLCMHYLQALSHLSGVRNALDIGCGSGILSLQAAYQWHIPVIGTDLSEAAIKTAKDNARTNQLDALTTFLRCDGLSHAKIHEHAPYDVILCNILAQSIEPMVRDIAAHTAEEGLVLLSGILSWQAEHLQHAFEQHHFTLLQKSTLSDWCALLLQKA